MVRMFQPTRKPEEILAYRTLRQILVAKPKGVLRDRGVLPYWFLLMDLRTPHI